MKVVGRVDAAFGSSVCSALLMALGRELCARLPLAGSVG